jgi:uncharacterized membrane protein YqjE
MSSFETRDRSLGSLVRELSEDLSTLVRSEIALAKLEVRQTFVSLGASGALLALALLFALCGLVFIFVTIVLALALVMPAWAASLVVAIALLAGAAGLGYAGVRKGKSVKFVPESTVAHVRGDIEAIRAGVGRERGVSDAE